MSNIFPPGNFTLDRSENDLSLHIHRIGAQVPNLFTLQAEDRIKITGGRGGSFYYKSSPKGLIVRQYLRGGMMRFVSHDKFVSLSKDPLLYRPFRELQILNYLACNNVSVPEVMAASVKRSGFLYRGMLATTVIEGSRNLAELNQKNCELVLIERFAEKAAEQALDVLKLGIFHPDLHPANVIVDAAGNIYLIDFDNAFKISNNLIGRLDLLKRWIRYCHKYQLSEGLVRGFERGMSGNNHGRF
ncbi:phosphotransferase [bacterium]|nr:phosphotransferase [bacterium]